MVISLTTISQLWRLVIFIDLIVVVSDDLIDHNLIVMMNGDFIHLINVESGYYIN